MPNERTYPRGEEPDVQVLADGQWHPGELRMWEQHPDGTWWGHVVWHPIGRNKSRFQAFPADRIRPDETDYSAGRQPSS